MTGFGRAEHSTDHYHAVVEISSVNRKNGEVVIQLPKPLISLEGPLRKSILKQFQRGRLQISITLSTVGENTSEAKLDHAALDALITAAQQLEERTGTPQPIVLADILRVGNIISISDHSFDQELANAAIEPAIHAAMKELITMRLLEGKHMKADILEKIQLLEAQVEIITTRAPSVIQQYRESLKRRLNEGGLELDLGDERLLKEIGIFAERCDISEEIARLGSHFLKFKEYSDSKESVGRSLDFLCQEMNREFNTIGSKANDATLAQHIVICKTELEKAREQVQNIE